MNKIKIDTHDIVGDKMKKELLWDLFKKTGKVEYYLKYKKALKEDD